MMKAVDKKCQIVKCSQLTFQLQHCPISCIITFLGLSSPFTTIALHIGPTHGGGFTQITMHLHLGTLVIALVDTNWGGIVLCF